MKELALNGKEEHVRQVATIDKFTVLLMRLRISEESLRVMSAKDLFIHGVDQGWIGKESVQNSELGKIDVTGEQARVEFIMNGQITSLKYQFRKESENWKMDLIALMPLINQAFKQLIKQQGMEEDEFVVSLLESLSGQKAPKDIWKPLNR